MRSFGQKIEIFRWVAVLAIAIGGASGAFAAPSEFSSDNLARAVSATVRGDKLRLTGVQREGAKVSSAFALESMNDPHFACGNAELPEQPRSLDAMLAEQLSTRGGLNVETPIAQALALPTRTGRVAIETDFEFYQLFNNTVTATNYIGNLLGYDSA